MRVSTLRALDDKIFNAMEDAQELARRAAAEDNLEQATSMLTTAQHLARAYQSFADTLKAYGERR